MKQKECAEHIALACRMVHLSLEEIKTLLYGKELYEISYSYENENDFRLEACLDTTTLACLFDENKICKGVFLFLDDPLNLIFYLEYCSKNYTCDTILKGWIADNCLICIQAIHAECCLLMLPLS